MNLTEGLAGWTWWNAWSSSLSWAKASEVQPKQALDEPCHVAHPAPSSLAEDKYPLCRIWVGPLRSQTAQYWLRSLRCASTALPQRGRGWGLLRIVARAVPTPACLEAGGETADLVMGSWFCSDWYHNPRKPKLMVWVARGWGLELPFPCQWCVCCYEKPCWLFWSRCCVGGRQCSLPFLLHPLSSPTKGTPSELNFLQWLQMCLRSLPASFHHLVLFLLEVSAISAAGCGNLWLQSNWEVGVPRTVQYPGLPHPLCC